MIKFTGSIIMYEYYNDEIITGYFRDCAGKNMYALLQLQEKIYKRIMEICGDDILARSDSVQIIANIVVPTMDVNEYNYARIKTLLDIPHYYKHPAIKAVLNSYKSLKTSNREKRAA